MRYVLLAVVPLAMAAATPTIAAPNAAVEAPIRAFVDAFNRGDVAAAKATNLPMVAITDEVAPFSWSGEGSFDRWLAALSAEEKTAGKSGGKVTIGSATREVVSGDRAYVITPATYRFTQGGVVKQEVAQFTFALVHRPAGWKIASWTWTGPAATPVK